jgi:glycerate 2-kinase
MKSPADLRSDALAIWQAGVAAVQSDRLIKNNVRIDGDWLILGDNASNPSFNQEPEATELRISSIHRIAVVGAGKAGAGMAAGLAAALGPQLLAEKHVQGWINVPADCTESPKSKLQSPKLPGDLGPSTLDLGPLASIHLHPARPAGINEPTAAGVVGSEKILEIVSSLGPHDLCICLLSGGGSALLPAPIAGVSLAEKLAITRLLSSGGANIEELNTVRKQLSRIKGGGLARACTAGRLVTLIISDVLGDPLDVIASGPTVPNTSTRQDALAILQRYGYRGADIPVCQDDRVAVGREANHRPACQVTNLVIGNNALAVDAAGIEAERRGYSHAMHAATSLEGPAEEIGRHLAQMALQMQSQPGPDCLITGGEPTVKLPPANLRGKGGRNQQLVLAALIELLDAPDSPRSKVQSPKLTSSTDLRPWTLDFLRPPLRRHRRRRRPHRRRRRDHRHRLPHSPEGNHSRPSRLPPPHRRLHFLRSTRRPNQNWPHPHQRLRFAGSRG